MHNRANTINTIILTLISPLLSLYFIAKNKVKVNKRVVLIVIITLYGITIPLTEEADGYVHQQFVYNEYLNMSLSRFLEDTYSILTLQVSSSSQDLYKHVISFVTGSLLGAPKLFFLIVSLVYGYFYSGVLLEIFKYFRFNKYGNSSIIIIGLISIFILNKNAEGIQTVRTWTGMWALIYGLIKYKNTNNKRYLLVLAFPPLIHFGYFLMAIPTYAVLFLGNKQKFVHIIFFASFIFSSGLGGFSGLIPASSLAEQKAAQYNLDENEQSAEGKLNKLENKSGTSSSNRTWYKKLQVYGYFVYPKFILIFLIFISGFHIRFMNSSELCVYLSGVLTMSLINFFSFIFAVANRTEIIGLSLICSSLIMCITRYSFQNEYSFFKANKQYKKVFLLYFILMIPQLVWWISFNVSQMSLFFISFPLVPYFVNDFNISVINAFKALFS